MEDKVIGLGKSKRVSKSPWERRIRKWVEDAQGKQTSQGCPRKANEPRMPKKKYMGQRSPQAM